MNGSYLFDNFNGPNIGLEGFAGIAKLTKICLGPAAKWEIQAIIQPQLKCPIHHQRDDRLEAYLGVAFLASCRQLTLKNRWHPLVLGLTPRAMLDTIAAMPRVGPADLDYKAGNLYRISPRAPSNGGSRIGT